VADRHYGNYTLRAGNVVGSAMSTVILSRRGIIGDPSSSSGDVRGRQQQRDAHAVAADDADHFRSHKAPSAGHRQGWYLYRGPQKRATFIFTITLANVDRCQ